LQGRNSRTNFLQEEGNDSILGSSTLFKDKDEALESQRWPLTICQAKELQNKAIRLQVQIKKLLIVEDELKTKGDKLYKFYNYLVAQIEVQEEED